MSVHDWKCETCGEIHYDILNGPPEDPCCSNPVLAITFETWLGQNYNSQRDFKSTQDTHTDTGFRRRFKASEDPTLCIEVSGTDKHGIATFNPEQRAYYANKMYREDSPALRKEMLRTRAENIKALGGTAPDTE